MKLDSLVVPVRVQWGVVVSVLLCGSRRACVLMPSNVPCLLRCFLHFRLVLTTHNTHTSTDHHHDKQKEEEKEKRLT